MAVETLDVANNTMPRVGLRRWAALLSGPADGVLEAYGDCADLGAIPASLRRRMGSFERAMACCALGVLADESQAETVIASRYGNEESLVSLLRSMTQREPVSPMAFSLSVHNALAGQLEQMRGDHSAHTALAAGRETFAMALAESYCKLVTAPSRPLVLVYGDAPLPDAYAEFADELRATTVVALLLTMNGNLTTKIAVGPVTGDHPPCPSTGSHDTARQLVAHLRAGSLFYFGAQWGPSWRIGPVMSRR